MKTGPTLVVVTFVNVTLVSPTRVPFSVIVAMVPLLLVTVTVTGLGGAAANEIEALTCKSRPTVKLPIVMFGAVTVAMSDWRLFGVLKLAGVARLIVVWPAAAGSNAVPRLNELPPPTNVVLPTIVP